VMGRRTDAKERLAGKLELRSQRIGRPLSEGEAQEIAQNLIGFFGTLHEWKAAMLKEHRLGRSGGANALRGAAPPQKFESCLGLSLEVAAADHMSAIQLRLTRPVSCGAYDCEASRRARFLASTAFTFSSSTVGLKVISSVPAVPRGRWPGAA
jgi:hypothetical protein